MIIGKLVAILSARTGAYTEGMKRARKANSQFEASAQSVKSLVIKVGAVLAGVAGTRALIGYTREQYAAVDALGKLSDELGTSTQMLTGFQHAAELTGTTNEQMQKGIQRMIRRIGEATHGYGEGMRALEGMGLSARRLAAIGSGAAMLEVAERIANIENAAQRAAAAYGLFGRSGQDLMNFLMLGRDNLRAIIEENERLEGSLTRLDAKKIEDANDSITRMKKSFKGLIRQVALGLAPTVNRVAAIATNLFIAMRERVLPPLARAVRYVTDAFKRLISPTVRRTVLQIANIASAGFRELGRIVGVVRTGFEKVFDAVQSRWDGLGQAVRDVQAKVLVALIALEWGLRNWRDVAKWAVTEVKADFQGFVDMIKHQLTVLIPGWAKDALAPLKDMTGFGGQGTPSAGLHAGGGSKIGGVTVGVIAAALSRSSLPGLIASGLVTGIIKEAMDSRARRKAWMEEPYDAVAGRPPKGPMESGQRVIVEWADTVKDVGKAVANSVREMSEEEKSLRESAAKQRAALEESFEKFVKERMASFDRGDGFWQKLFKGFEAFSPDLGAKMRSAAENIDRAGRGLRPGALERGSVEAYSAALNGGLSPMSAVQRNTADTAKSNKMIQRSVEEVARLTKLKPFPGYGFIERPQTVRI